MFYFGLVTWFRATKASPWSGHLRRFGHPARSQELVPRTGADVRSLHPAPYRLCQRLSTESLFVCYDICMKITKLVHSCLLVEKGDKKILVDPGVYSWQDEKVKKTDFSNISTVIVTHNHSDHFSKEFARTVMQASPNAKWYGTQEIVDTLKEWGITGLLSSKDEDVQFIKSEHADLSPWFDKQPEHTSYVIFSDILISGDCQTLTSAYGARILAGAINGGPWGAVVGFSKMIESMADKPKIVVPLHDWHWNEDARIGIYARLAEVLGKFDVEFMQIESCVSQEI